MRRRMLQLAAAGALLVGAGANGQTATARPSTPPTAREAEERLALWLERQGLDRLLGDLLEGRLDRETSDLERRDLAERLSAIVVRRLRAGELDPDGGGAIAAKLRPLLPDVDADELALEVLRARGRREEQRLERLRLGRPAAGEDAAAVTASLRAVVAEAERIRRHFEVDLKQDDRRLDRSIGLEAESLLDTVDRKRVILESTRFVQAWANLHLAMLLRSGAADREGGRARGPVGESNELARTARDLFVALLDTGVDDPRPGDVSVDRRSEESFASAVLGAAISRTLLSGAADGEPWFALLSDARTAVTVRRSAPGWKLLALLQLRDFASSMQALDALAQRGAVPAAWLRMAVIESLTGDLGSGGAAFVQAALAQLAAQEELAEVVELSERLPDAALPENGFVAGYIRGLREYHAARAGSSGDADAFRHAATILLQAVREKDAAASPTARAAAQQLAAWCLVGAGDHAQASPLFEQAAESLPANRAAEALWLAAESAARAAIKGQGDRAQLEQASARLIDLLIRRFPESAFATRAEIARIRGRTGAGRDELARLMAVPRGSSAWPEAQLAAEELLYGLFRAAPAGERPELAAQYLEVAREEEAPNASSRRTWLRRRIETALSLGAARVDDASAAIASLRARGAAGEFALSDIESELALRELQVAAIQGRLDDAARMLRDLEASAPGTPLLAIGRRSMFIAARNGADERAREAVIDLGASILDADGATMDDASMTTIALAMARAALDLDASAPTTAARWASAVRALRAARERRPGDPAVLDALASLAEKQGDEELAVECLRALVAGLPAREPEWFEARVRQLRMLERRDPSLARAVLDQHRALVPDWGPDPWGRELEAIDRRIPGRTEAATP